MREDANILAECIYHEARGEGYEGMVAVGSVVLNRLDSKRWGTSLYDVIYAPAQFEWTLKKHLEISEIDSFEKCIEIAKGLLDKSIQRNTDALFYHAKKKMPIWAYKMKLVQEIGNQKFYKEKTV